jgi:hypothetical protein
MATGTGRNVNVQRGAIPLNVLNVGVIKCTGLTFANGASANDRDTAFTMKADTIVLGLWLKRTTGSTNSVTCSVGKGSDGAGSATTLSGELAVNATGVICGSTIDVPVVVAADETVVVEISGDPGAAAPVFDLYMLVADAATA